MIHVILHYSHLDNKLTFNSSARNVYPAYS